MTDLERQPVRVRRRRLGFGEDFRRFFLRGLATLLPTLITLWLLVWVWDFLWENLGRHIIWGIRGIWPRLAAAGLLSKAQDDDIALFWNYDYLRTRLIGVGLAVILVYVVGVFVGNFIGRAAWRLSEIGVLRIPIVRAIYPAVKQVTDFLLSNRGNQFSGARVVAVRVHEDGIWSIGLVTSAGLRSLDGALGGEMLTVFVPSSPTSFSGYVVVAPRANVVELPLSVEEAMRLLVSGGVISPEKKG